LWDATGQAWTAFALLCVCALGLTVIGAMASRYPAAAESIAA
jgi:hypothetical protein